MTIKPERRNSSRNQLTRQARLDFYSEVYEECLIQNSSLTGMFIHGDFQQNEGDHCVINFFQKGKFSKLAMEVSAQVVRKDNTGVGIAFTSMPLESLMLLQMILHCGDGAESLSREIKSFDNLPFKLR